MMQNYLLPESIRRELIAYLMSRPMGEVEQAVNVLRRLQPAPEEPAKTLVETDLEPTA